MHAHIKEGIYMLQAATAPIAMGLFYLYLRDCYEKEPWQMLLWGVVFGIYTTFVIYGVGLWLEYLFPHVETPWYTSFISSALVEEGVKLLFAAALITHNRNYNEPFDGIVYCVFISLGFAWLENLVYVTHPVWGGYGTALARAVVSVPGHALFGIQMGYWFSQTRFLGHKWGYLLSFLAPYLCHGIYNYFLLSKWQGTNLCFWIFFVFLWINGFRKMRLLLVLSPFRVQKS